MWELTLSCSVPKMDAKKLAMANDGVACRACRAFSVLFLALRDRETPEDLFADRDTIQRLRLELDTPSLEFVGEARLSYLAQCWLLIGYQRTNPSGGSRLT